MPRKSKSAKKKTKKPAKKAAGRTKKGTALLSGIEAGAGRPANPRAEALPDAERRKRIEAQKARLVARLEEIQGGVEHNLETYHSSAPVARGDASDLAADSLDSDTALQLVQSSSSEITQIDEALRKIEDGSYGKCESCGEDIPWTRLEAVPYAIFCVECKRRQELAAQSEGGPVGWSAVDELEEVEPE